MIPNSVLRGPVKEWKAALQLNGQVVELAGGLPRRQLGFSQPRGTCTLATRAFPDAPAGCDAKVLLTLNGSYTTTFFTGRMDARPISDLPLSYELGLVDSLARLSVPLDEELVWSGRSFPDAVRDLLTRAGVASEEIGAIFDPGADYAVGPVDEVVLPAGRMISDAMTELLTYGGCGLFALPEGELTVVDAPGWPGATDASTPVYAFGAAGDEFGFFNARRTMVGAESVVSKFTAKGPRLSTRKIADATFTVSGVSGKTVTETYPLLQTDACAKKIAEREIVRRNRAATEVDVSAPLNPNLRPGGTILFRHAELGFPTNTPAIIIGCASQGDEMTLSISVGARPADGEVSIIPPPNANFTMRYEVQPVSVQGVLATATVVEATNTSADPSEFEITSLQWTATCNGDRQPEPSSSSEQQPIFVFPTLDGATITLVVESSSGEGAEKTRAVSPPPAEVFTRALSVAAGGAGWRVLFGPTGWRSFTGAGADCTAVPGINDTGPLLAGFANGKLYRSNDYLATPPELLFIFPSGVTCIFVNEANPQEILVGAGDLLARSSDGGTSWSPIASFNSTVSYVESSPANPAEMRVCVGELYLITMDGGATFNCPDERPDAGATCRKVASAPWGHLIIWSGTSVNVQGDPLTRPWQFEEGHEIDWSQVPAEHMPADLAAATPLQYEAGYLVASGPAGDVVRDGLYAQLGYLAATSAGAKLYKLTQGGPGFVAQYLGDAAAGGPHKVVMAGGKAFPIDDTTVVSQAHRIGYGQATDPARPPQLALLPYRLSGTMDKLWHYTPELGWTPRDLPANRAEWLGIDICRQNPNEWLIWTSNRAFWTGNAGRIWTELLLPQGNFGRLSISFTGARREWCAALFGEHWYGTGRWYQTYLAFGQGGDTLRHTTIGSSIPGSPAPDGNMRALQGLVPGYDGEVWAQTTAEQASYGSSLGTQFDHTYNHVAWIDPSGLTIHDVGASPYAPACPEGHQSTRAGYAVWNSNITRTANYRTTLPQADGAVAAGTSVAWCGAGLFVGGRDGIAEIRTFNTSPEVVVVAGGGYLIRRIVAGSQLRGAGAMGTTADGVRRIFAHNGMQWTSTDLPEGMGGACERIGVIEP